MLLLGVLKLRNMYILPPVNVSILFSPLLDFVLKLFSEVDLVLFYLICCSFTVRNHGDPTMMTIMG